MFWLRSDRGRLPAWAAAALVPVALVVAPPSTANPGPDEAAVPVDTAVPCCVENLPEAPVAEFPEAALPAVELAEAAVPDAELTDALPDALVQPASRTLGPGVGSEAGLQVKTVLAERSVSALFPAVHTIIGVRPDAKPWHPAGRAIDVMIPNPGSADGVEMGNAIRDFALSHAAELGVQDVIWQGTYYTPAGPSGSGYGHFDHVHITTIGGGYASGDEEYILP